jgi:hypothetical protein
MQEIDKIACQLNNDSNLRDIRRAIATLMLDQLYALQAMPRRWEKVHFANAVAALAMIFMPYSNPPPCGSAFASSICERRSSLFNRTPRSQRATSTLMR